MNEFIVAPFAWIARLALSEVIPKEWDEDGERVECACPKYIPREHEPPRCGTKRNWERLLENQEQRRTREASGVETIQQYYARGTDWRVRSHLVRAGITRSKTQDDQLRPRRIQWENRPRRRDLINLLLGGVGGASA